MIKLLIIEDDPFIAEDMMTLLQDEGYEADICTNGHKAEEKIEDYMPDLILLDITLNDGLSGIDLGKKVKSTTNLPIIFITSHSDKHTISIAKEIEPVGYLVKPIQPHSLISTVEIGFNQHQANNQTNEIEGAIFVKDKHRMVKVEFEDIYYAEAYDNYTNLYTQNGKYLLSHTLKKVENKLAKEGFKRVHRSYMVNVSHISGYEDGVIFFHDLKVPVGRTYKEEVLKMFNTF